MAVVEDSVPNRFDGATVEWAGTTSGQQNALFRGLRVFRRLTGNGAGPPHWPRALLRQNPSMDIVIIVAAGTGLSTAIICTRHGLTNIAIDRRSHVRAQHHRFVGHNYFLQGIRNSTRHLALKALGGGLRLILNYHVIATSQRGADSTCFHSARSYRDAFAPDVAMR